jgi:hypothetical protein
VKILDPTGTPTQHIIKAHSKKSKSTIRMHVKEDETDRACSMHVEKINAYTVLVGKPDGKGHDKENVVPVLY